MKTDEEKNGRGKEKSNTTINDIKRIHIGNMPTFLQFLTPLRLKLLNILRLFVVPVSEKVLAGLLHQPVEKIHDDVAQLAHYGLVRRYGGQKLSVPWDSIQITVRQVYPYLPHPKIVNIVDSYLSISAKNIDG